jgi:hypothetical protein
LRQIGTANSSFSLPTSSATAPSKCDLESAVAVLLEIKRENTEFERAIDRAVQLMTDRDFTIDFLSTALEDVPGQLKVPLADLDLDGEMSGAIERPYRAVFSPPWTCRTWATGSSSPQAAPLLLPLPSPSPSPPPPPSSDGGQM